MQGADGWKVLQVEPPHSQSWDVQAVWVKISRQAALLHLLATKSKLQSGVAEQSAWVRRSAQGVSEMGLGHFPVASFAQLAFLQSPQVEAARLKLRAAREG